MTLNPSDLPLTSSHWGTYRVETAEGVVAKLHDFEDDPDPSPIGHGIVDVLDGPTRITSPMVRESWLRNGPGNSTHLRGNEPFVEVSWSRAEALVADEVRRIRAEHGNQAIFGGSYGWSSAGRFHHAQSQLHRFLNCAGGYTRSVNTYSFAAAEVIVPHVLGVFRPFVYGGPTWNDIIANAELVVAFGGMALKNGQINQGGIGRHTQQGDMRAAIDAGIDFVNLSPMRSDVLSEAGALWIAPRPGTDVAILLALANTLLSERRHDEAFLASHTVGFDDFARYLLGDSDGIPKTPEWAAGIADIDADEIRDLARRMSENRTLLSVSWSLTRQDHGEQPFWAAIALGAMLGQVGLPGQGVAMGLSAMNDVGNNVQPLPAASLPQGVNPVDDCIPVARISDMLLSPGADYSYNGRVGTYPDIKMLWWAGGNPFHHHQDLARLMKAWRHPDTIIVNDWSWNANAKFADIVLPCTTPLERDDIQITPRDSFVSVMKKVIDPVGDSRNDHDIFVGIANRLGLEGEFTEGRGAEEWIAEIYEQTRTDSEAIGVELPTLAELRADQWHQMSRPSVPTDSFGDFRNGEPLHTPSGRIEICSSTVAGFGLSDCMGHPAWFEPREWLGAGDTTLHPLHLISNQPANKLHSQLDHGSVSRASKINGREPITMHPLVAEARGLVPGDVVRVFNTRGSCLAGVVIDEGLRPDVVQLATGAWFDPIEVDGRVLCKHGNPNVLTRDEGTSSLAQGPAAQSCLVDIEKYHGPELPVTAFDPPMVITE